VHVLALSPDQAVDLADEAFNRGDIDGMLAFYEEEAVMLFEPGRAIRGRVAIRAALQPLMTAKLIAKHEARYVIEAGDIALWISAWSVIGTAADGVPMSRNGRNAVVFRRGVDGGWRVAVENPWGAAVLDGQNSSAAE
jgi:uncharacterized protein (TIGR02246 family)